MNSQRFAENKWSSYCSQTHGGLPSGLRIYTGRVNSTGSNLEAFKRHCSCQLRINEMDETCLGADTCKNQRPYPLSDRWLYGVAWMRREHDRYSRITAASSGRGRLLRSEGIWLQRCYRAIKLLDIILLQSSFDPLGSNDSSRLDLRQWTRRSEQ
jgi:hypothetical protein